MTIRHYATLLRSEPAGEQLFHQVHAPAHSAVVAAAAVRDWLFKLVQDPPCSPDLAASD